MTIWQGFIGLFSLLITNMFILRSLAQLDPQKKVPGFLKSISVIAPIAYGGSLYLGWAYQSDFLILSYSIFFLNNLWFLVFFRNTVFSLLLPIKVRRGFLFSMIVFFLPAILSVAVMDFTGFTNFIFLISYILGLFPLMMYLSTIVGLSVTSITWGILLSAFLFSIDLFLRSGFIPIFAEDYRFASSELFRCFSVGIGAFVFRLGKGYPKLEEKQEILPGSKQLSNVFFVILAVFPVMIFYAAFWQANLNYRDSQKKEIFLAQEVFSLSLKMIENESSKYARIIQDVRNTSTIANAQWRLRSFQFSEPELELVQILTTYPVGMEGISVSFQEDRFEIYADTDKGWGIKMVLNTQKIYQHFPLNPQQQLYLFYDQIPVFRPSYTSSSAFGIQPTEYEFAFQSVASFLGHELDAYLVFQTSIPMLSQFTIVFLMVAILVLVLIWFFYDLYLANWEKKVQNHIRTLVSTRETMHTQMEKTSSEMRILRKDLSLSEQIRTLLIRTYSDYIALFLRFQFPPLSQGKTQYSELNHLLDRINHSLAWSPKVFLVQKGSSGWIPISVSKREYQAIELHAIPDEVDFARYTYRVGKETDTGVILSRRDLALLVSLDDAHRELSLDEQTLLQVGMDFAAFYVRIHKQLNKAGHLTYQYMWISEMLMNTSDHPQIEDLITSVLSLFHRFYRETVLIGMVHVCDDQLTCYSMEDGSASLQKTHLNGMDYDYLVQKIYMGAPVFSELFQEQKPIHPNGRSGILLPLFGKTPYKFAVVVEFVNFQVFPAIERELLFFLGKVLSHLFTQIPEQGTEKEPSES